MSDFDLMTTVLDDIASRKHTVTLTWSPELGAWRVFMPLIVRLLVQRIGPTAAQDRAVCYHHDPREAYDILRRRLNEAMLSASYDEGTP